MKKIISIFLVCTIVFSCICLSAFSTSAATDTKTGKYSNEITSKTKGFTYKFNVDVAGKYTFKVSGELQKYGITISSATMKFVDEAEYSGTFYKALYLNKGTYNVKISAVDKYVGKFDLDYSFTPVYEVFSEEQDGSNNTFETADSIKVETIYLGLIAENDDVDTYKITSKNACFLSVKIATEMPQCDIVLYDESKKVIWNATTLYGEASNTVRLSAGTYYVQITKHDGYTGTYELDTTYIMLGDVNFDGKVNVVDATNIQKYMAALIKFTNVQVQVADFDCNGKTNIFDATGVQKFAGGLLK